MNHVPCSGKLLKFTFCCVFLSISHKAHHFKSMYNVHEIATDSLRPSAVLTGHVIPAVKNVKLWKRNGGYIFNKFIIS